MTLRGDHGIQFEEYDKMAGINPKGAANFCKPLLRVCDKQIDESCLMCLAEYFIKENRKIKDEIKLLNVHLQQVIEECKALKSIKSEEVAQELNRKLRQTEMLKGGDFF